jgi:hypothetical protein
VDTTETATKLGTTPRILRQFLRSNYSTFVAVGSGSRYDFNERDLPMLDKRFSEWKGGVKSKATKTRNKKSPVIPPVTRPRLPKPSKKDRAVWEEEGQVEIEDIRSPRVRARVKADAQAAEDRLMMLLMAKGMHVSQLGDRRKVA